MAVTVTVRVALVVVGSVRVAGPGSVSSPMPPNEPASMPTAGSGAPPAAMPAAGTATRPVTVLELVAGAGPLIMVSVADTLFRAEAVVVVTARSGAGTPHSTGSGSGYRTELAGVGPLGAEFRSLAARSWLASLARSRAGPMATIGPPTGPVSGTATGAGRPLGAARSGSGAGCTTGAAGAAGAVPEPEPTLRAGTAAVSAARPGGMPGAVPGTASARWLGGRVWGSLRRGHRPIIARTARALCSPRPN